MSLPRSIRQERWLLETTPEVCAECAPFVRPVIAEARRNGVLFSDDALDFFSGMTLLAAGVRAVRANPVTNPVVTGAETLSSAMVETVTFSVSELAAKTGRSRQSIQERIDRKTLPAVKNGRGHWRVSAENAADLMGGTA